MNFKLAGLVILALSNSAQAQDLLPGQDDAPLSLSGDVGFINLSSNELVYRGEKRVSQLAWKSEGVQIYTGTLLISLPREWRLTATAGIGLNGNSHMVDHDWIAPFSPGIDDNQWSHRSLHPDTRLDHFFTAGVEIGRDLWVKDQTTAGLGLGFKYADVQWSAWGGSFLYSQNSFRDSRGEFSDSEKGISFRQRLPVPYLGIHVAHISGNWSLEGALQGGLAVAASSTDNHWIRRLTFDDRYDVVPTLALKAKAAYSLRENLSLYLSGGFDTMIRAKGDTTITSTNQPGSEIIRNSAGGDYRSMMISFGLKGAF